MTFQNAERFGIKVKQLDSLYLNAIPSATYEGVFKGSKDFDIAWGKFYKDLLDFMAGQGLKWSKPQDCFNKVYFTKDGVVEHWFFNFPLADNVPADIQIKYRKIVEEFSKDHKIKIKADKNFSQCATVTLMEL
jgi:hypothetical protein